MGVRHVNICPEVIIIQNWFTDQTSTIFKQCIVIDAAAISDVWIATELSITIDVRTQDMSTSVTTPLIETTIVTLIVCPLLTIVVDVIPLY